MSAMDVEWKDGGSEPFIWAHEGQTWCAVWARSGGFAAWASSLRRSRITDHPTKIDAMAWCESRMREDAADG